MLINTNITTKVPGDPLEEHQPLNQLSISYQKVAVQKPTLDCSTAILHVKANNSRYFLISSMILVSLLIVKIQYTYRFEEYERTPVIQKQSHSPGITININPTQVLKQALVDRLQKGMKETAIKTEKELASQIFFKKVEDIKQEYPSHSFNKIPPIQTKPSIIQKPIVVQTKSKIAWRPIAGITGEQRQFSTRLLALKDQDLTTSSKLADQERNYYETKYNLSQFTTELPFCIVVPSFNNAEGNRHFKNMRSILMQEYKNFHIVFIDDASTDGTGVQIEAMLSNQTILPSDRYVIIKNTEQRRAMPNLRMAAFDYCKAEEIFLIVDGDDQLLGRQVLRLFNTIFQSKGVWFMYTNFLSVRGTVGYSRPFPPQTILENNYRRYSFVTSHLRAFYTQLFRNINQDDLKDGSGEYLKAANDVAICIPILQQAYEKVVYISELAYYYNSNTGLNNHKLRLKEQKANDRMLRKRKPYKALTELFPSVAK